MRAPPAIARDDRPDTNPAQAAPFWQLASRCYEDRCAQVRLVGRASVVDGARAKRGPIVFLLWGRRAQAKGSRIDRNRHIVIESPHPSPYSSWRGFAGSRPFGRANEALGQHGAPEIDWCLE